MSTIPMRHQPHHRRPSRRHAPDQWTAVASSGEGTAHYQVLKRVDTNEVALVRTERPQTILENINAFIADQNSMHRFNFAFVLLIEFYRLLVSCLLLVFVPQLCMVPAPVHSCSYEENMQVSGTLTQRNWYITGLFFNYTTMAAFLVLYAIEITREERLIRHLDVSPRVKEDNETMRQVLSMLEPEHLKELREVQDGYRAMAIIVTILYIVNTAISARVISDYSAGNLTVSTFVTNVLFMMSKLTTVYYVNTTEDCIFISAYNTAPLQFNALDPDEAKHAEMMKLFGSVKPGPALPDDASASASASASDRPASSAINGDVEMASDANTYTETASARQEGIFL